jgi:histone H3/H4
MVRGPKLQRPPKKNALGARREGKSKKSGDKASSDPKSASSESPKSGEKRKHRWHAGTVGLRMVKRAQKSTDMLLKKAPMMRLVRAELARTHPAMRVSRSALERWMEYCQTSLLRATQVSISVMVRRKAKGLAGEDYDVALQAGNVYGAEAIDGKQLAEAVRALPAV